MSLCRLIIPVILFSYFLFWAGYRLAGSLKSPQQISAILLIAVISALPAALFLLYYTRIFDSWCAFYEFRSIKNIELTAAGAGFTAGIISKWGAKKRLLSIPGMITLLTLGIILPYAKSLLTPAQTNKFSDSWNGAVCRQSTGYSCGAACAATLLHHFGIKVTESQIAGECFTSRRGTESWYIAREIRSRGLKTRFLTKTPPDRVPVPCIAGVMLGHAGHFITVLEDLGDSYRTGDPLVGDRIVSKTTLTNRYQFTGFFMMVASEDDPQSIRQMR